MEAVEFAHWLAAMDRLSPMQRAVALERLGGGPETAGPARREPIVGCASDVAGSTARTKGGDLGRTSRIERDALGAVGERKVESVGCPHCRGRDVIAWGRSHGLPRYRCKSCRRTFNAATMTPMARLRKRDRWFDQAQAMLEGVSLAKAAARCGVHASTAYRWRHRFLSAPALDKPRTLQGVVEADETFILELFKGRRSGLTRKPRRRGGKALHPGSYFENIPVLVARDRAGATIDAVLPEDTAACIAQALGNAVTPANQLVCDGGSPLRAFARRAKIPMRVVPAPGSPRPDAPEIHINNVNAYHGRLKEWLRRFHGVATKNLPNYLGWRRAIEAWGDKASPRSWLLGAFGSGPYQRLTR